MINKFKLILGSPFKYETLNGIEKIKIKGPLKYEIVLEVNL